MYPNTIAFSFGRDSQRLRFYPKDDLPGPGSYQDYCLKIKKKTESFSFGKVAKFSKLKSETPGPGWYEKNEGKVFGKGTPSYTIGKSSKPHDVSLHSAVGIGPISSVSLLSKIKNTPGPGEYIINNDVIDKIKPRPKSVRIGKSSKDINYETSSPGPCKYYADKNAVSNKSPTWSLPRSKRDVYFLIPKNAYLLPGPAEYLSKSELGFKNSGFRFGTDKKLKHSKSEYPGPGNYFIPSAIGYFPSYARNSSSKLFN